MACALQTRCSANSGIAAACLAASLLAFAPKAAAQPGIAADPPAFSFPVDLDTYRFTAAFDLDRTASDRADWTGWRQGDPTGGNGHAYDDHSGTDIGIATGTSLYAVASGTVSSLYEDYPTDDHSGGGNYMIFSHPDGSDTYRVNFWHLNYQGALKSAGNAVAKGEHVAYSDNTGNSTGPHLHCGFSKQNATNNYTCGFYHGWWETDEFYYGVGYPCLTYIKVNPGVTSLNVREGTSTSYSVITTLSQGGVLVSSQNNTWWRVFLPMPPASARQAVDGVGAPGAGYAESGTWLADADRSSVVDPSGDANAVALDSAGSRYSEFTGTGGADSATFTFQVPQRGTYNILATFPEAANATNVTYRIAHLAGSTDVAVDQGHASGGGGTGTHADPYIVAANPYIANHTTVGGDDTWNSYSPAGSGINEAGPERLYRFDVAQSQDVTVTVDHSGYPSLDIDIHLLGSLSNADCLVRNDWTFTYAVTPGTYYIAADSYGTTNNAATSYKLTVEFEKESFSNSWTPVGTYSFDRATDYTVQILENAVTGRVDTGRPGRVYADAIKLEPVLTHRTGWVSNSSSFTTRVNTASEPKCSIVVSNDALDGNDSNDFDDYAEFPVYAAAGDSLGNTSAVVAKVATGQRFVCTGRTADGWYRILLTDSSGASEGWIGGTPLRIFNASEAPIVVPSDIEGWRRY